MTSATATPVVTTTQIEMPAGVAPLDFHVSILNAGGTQVAEGSAPTAAGLQPLNVSTLPSGTYTMKAQRRTTVGQPIGTPVLQTFVLDQTVEVPGTLAVTLG